MVIVRYKYIFCVYYIIERSKKKGKRGFLYKKEKSDIFIYILSYVFW